MSAPRDFHFVFGLKPQHEPFHLAHYLCLASCLATNAPRALHFHCRHLPFGEWWERIAPMLDIHRVGNAPPPGFDRARYRESAEGRLIEAAGFDYAHEADFLRLAILEEAGGVYVDMDTLFVARYPDRWFEAECVLGEEAPMPGVHGTLEPSLCNAVIVARPRSAFLREWIVEGARVFDGSWSRHSCATAARIWARDASGLTVLPQHVLYRHTATRTGIASLFESGDEGVPACVWMTGRDLRDSASLHLWAHLWWSEQRTDFSRFHAGMITPRWIAEADATYARVARRFMPAA